MGVLVRGCPLPSPTEIVVNNKVHRAEDNLGEHLHQQLVCLLLPPPAGVLGVNLLLLLPFNLCSPINQPTAMVGKLQSQWFWSDPHFQQTAKLIGLLGEEGRNSTADLQSPGGDRCQTPPMAAARQQAASVTESGYPDAPVEPLCAG